ncbi:MAG TPA: hypothetical protein VMV52_06095 [Candidatus Nanopelagicaceae bacterium]|nr:hypothetical protein [Candidatus Nanopelagicaceae bacterium]
MEKPEWFEIADAADRAPEPTDTFELVVTRASRLVKGVAAVGAATLIIGAGVAFAQANHPSPAQADTALTSTSTSEEAVPPTATNAPPVAMPIATAPAPTTQETTPPPATPAPKDVVTEPRRSTSVIAASGVQGSGSVQSAVTGPGQRPTISGVATGGSDDSESSDSESDDEGYDD